MILAHAGEKCKLEWHNLLLETEKSNGERRRREGGRKRRKVEWREKKREEREG